MSRLIKDNYRAPVKLPEICLDAQRKPILINTKTSFVSFEIIIFTAMNGSKIRFLERTGSDFFGELLFT